MAETLPILADVEKMLCEIENISCFLKDDQNHYLIKQKVITLSRKMQAVLRAPELQMNALLLPALQEEFGEFQSALQTKDNMYELLSVMKRNFTALLFFLGGGKSMIEDIRRMPGPPVILNRKLLPGSPERATIETHCRLLKNTDLPQCLSMDSWGSRKPWSQSKLMPELRDRNTISIAVEGTNVSTETDIRDLAFWLQTRSGGSPDDWAGKREHAEVDLRNTFVPPRIGFGLYRMITEKTNVLLKTCIHPAFRGRDAERQLITNLVGRAHRTGKHLVVMYADQFDDDLISSLSDVGFQAKKQKNGQFEKNGRYRFTFNVANPDQAGKETLMRVKHDEMPAHHEQFTPVWKGR